MDTKKYEAKLKELEADITKQLGGIGEAADMGNDIDGYDTETEEAEEFSNLLGSKDSLKKRLLAVRAALTKVGNGTYGKCAKCGMEISAAVLDADPESELCQNCKA